LEEALDLSSDRILNEWPSSRELHTLNIVRFRSRTHYTDDGGYENQNPYVLIIIKSKAIKSLCWLF
jgi:hypothetical protein